MKETKIIFMALVIAFFYSCNNPNKQTNSNSNISVEEVHLLTNYSSKTINVDYENAIDDGFVIPSKSQTKNGMFDIDFKIKNLTDSTKTYYYKIYYQNESYKFPDCSPSNAKLQHQYAHENFYGSWEDTNIGFKKCGSLKPSEEKEIFDSFRIVGNPRNEEKYFFEGVNDRWKRNPRVGDYSLLLVVVDENTLNKIPEYIKNIKLLKDGNFVSPYFYFLNGDGKSMSNGMVKFFNKVINLKAEPDLGAGVFINDYLYKTKSEPGFEDYYNCNCNDGDELYKSATVAQFLHYIDESSKFNNIPVIEDFFKGNFSQEEYNWGRAFYKTEERIAVLPQTEKQPCENIISDTVARKIIIKNPKSTYGNWQKQNAGMITRHGFTYGKFTVKAKLTELLNKDDMWNGITNAIWLIYQGGRGSDETGWNLRRPCKEKGYMKTYWGGRNDERVERVAYSEIDFEILKTVPYCPDSKFPPVYDNYEAKSNFVKAWNTKLPEDVLKDKKNIVVACTNWDMACWEPKNFSSGCQSIEHNGITYLAHRWEDCYRAITTKFMAPDDVVFGSKYYYFQIDWQPDKIIWRIGPEKNQLYEVGYIDQTISMIPDNQMLLIITQEFHNTQWWPGTPYLQENIPFPKEDYIGEIFEITIE